MPRNIISTHTFTTPDGRQITYTKLKPNKTTAPPSHAIPN